MAASPQFKVYSKDGEYLAAFKYPDDAAMFVASAGGEVRLGHTKNWTLWREGEEEIPAAESFDRVAQIMVDRLNKLEEGVKERRRAIMAKAADARGT